MPFTLSLSQCQAELHSLENLMSRLSSKEADSLSYDFFNFNTYLADSSDSCSKSGAGSDFPGNRILLSDEDAQVLESEDDQGYCLNALEPDSEESESEDRLESNSAYEQEFDATTLAFMEVSDDESLPPLNSESSSTEDSESGMNTNEDKESDDSESDDEMMSDHTVPQAANNVMCSTSRRKVKPAGIEKSPVKKRRRRHGQERERNNDSETRVSNFKTVTVPHPSDLTITGLFSGPDSEYEPDSEYDSDSEEEDTMLSTASGPTAEYIERKYNVELQPNGEFHMLDSKADSGPEADVTRSKRYAKSDDSVFLEPAPMKRQIHKPLQLVHSNRFHARAGRKYIIGGPGCTSQDVISVSCSPALANGKDVVIDRFQVLRNERRKGYGKKALACLAKIYKQAKALSLSVPAATSQGAKFYRKHGFVKNDMQTWVLDLKRHTRKPVTSEFKTPSPDVRPDQKLNFVVTGKGEFCEVKCRTMNRTYHVPRRRLVKALKNLNPRNISKTLLSQDKGNVCLCRNKCPSKVTVAEVLDAREKYWAIPTEPLAKNYIIGQLREMSKRDKSGKLVYSHKVADIQVCSLFYGAFMGVSKAKISSARKVVASGGTTAVHASVGKFKTSPDGEPAQKTICMSFWSHFFETAQRPNNDIRLMPANLPIRHIYECIFSPWYKNQTTPGSGGKKPRYDIKKLPSYTTFQKARNHKKFKDVKRRPQHYHARCKTCAKLEKQRLRGFKTGHHENEFLLALDLHQAEIRAWRDHEDYIKSSVSRAPHAKQLFLYDDTSCLKLPHFTNRDLKNLTQSRVNVIPFYFGDYGSNDAAYIYTVKNRFKKGANRLCTTLYHAIRRSKYRKCDANSHLARHLVLQADNYCENKNSEVLFFASELVWRGWYDIIDVEYGPVGHTHNGSDAVHKIHNVVCGSFVSLTLGQFIDTFDYGFLADGTKPAACVLDVQYNWRKRYCRAGYSIRLAGFTNTAVDMATVSAFRIRRKPSSTGSHVEVMWKKDTTDQQWRGMDKGFNTPGFVMLRKLPSGAPKMIPPGDTIIQKKYVRELCGLGMRRAVQDQAANQAEADSIMTWVSRVVKTGLVVEEKDMEGLTSRTNAVDDSEWGPLVNVGIPSTNKNCYAIGPHIYPMDEKTKKNFWKLPDEVEQDMQTRALQLQNIRHVHANLPNVRYATTDRSKKKASSSKNKASSSSSSAGASSSSSSSHDHDNDWGGHFTECKLKDSASSSSSTDGAGAGGSSKDGASSSRTAGSSSSSHDHDNDWGGHFTECKDSASSSSSTDGAVAGSSSKDGASSSSTAGANSSSSSSSITYDHDNDWGAHFTECTNGRFAVQSVAWEKSGRKGIAVVQVLHSKTFGFFFFFFLFFSFKYLFIR